MHRMKYLISWSWVCFAHDGNCWVTHPVLILIREAFLISSLTCPAEKGVVEQLCRHPISSQGQAAISIQWNNLDNLHNMVMNFLQYLLCKYKIILPSKIRVSFLSYLLCLLLSCSAFSIIYCTCSMSEMNHLIHISSWICSAFYALPWVEDNIGLEIEGQKCLFP